MRAIVYPCMVLRLACTPLAARLAQAEGPLPNEAAHADDRKAIVDIVRAENCAWNRDDAEASGARMLPETTSTNIVGNTFVGRDAFVENMRGLLTRGSCRRNRLFIEGPR